MENLKLNREKFVRVVSTNFVNNFVKFNLLVVLIIVSQACSNQAQRVYQESSFGVALEVPPDLTKPSRQDELSFLDSRQGNGNNDTVSGRAQINSLEASSVVPEFEHIKLAKDGAQRWLVLQGEPRKIWPWIREFWIKNDFELSLEQPIIGLIETDWKQQRNNLPMKNNKVAGQEKAESTVYAVPTREKYRVRLDRGEQEGTTEVYLTHRGVELLADGKLIVWKLRPSDVELEADMLNRLAVFLAGERKKLDGPLAATNRHLNVASLIKDESGRPMLKVDIEFSRVWRRVGLILDRMNYVIESSERSIGVYHLIFKDVLQDESVKEKPGWFSSWFSGSSESSNLQVVLRDEGASTHITVRNPDGKYSSEEKATSLLKEMINQIQ